jgi:DNA repair photolyase
MFNSAAAVFLSVTTLDGELARKMEPRASTPQMRLEAIRLLAEAGVPVGVLVAPVIPGLTDHEIISIVSGAARAGARYAGYVVLRLPHGVAELFQEWLQRHFPDRKNKVLSHIRDVRGGKLNESQFGARMRGEGVFSKQVQAMFAVACRRAAIYGRSPQLSTEAFRRPGSQLALFE